MRLVLKIIGALVLLLGLAVTGMVIALNTGAGRQFAVKEINRLAGPAVRVAGLGGHFPADIKLQSLQLTDATGIWLHAETLELRWRPLALLHHYVDVTALTAARIEMLRPPTASGTKSSSSGGLHGFRIGVDRLEVGLLSLGPAMAGEPINLHVQGNAHIFGPARDDAQLDATTADGRAQYHLTAALDHETANIHLNIAEPPGGLIGHFAGARVSGPLTADLTLAGQRDDAALNFSAALGAAKLAGTGRVGLVPAKAFADVTITIPDLAPFSALATARALGGSATFHLRAAQAGQGNATLALNGDVALRGGPAQIRKLLGPRDEISLQAGLRQGDVTIQALHLGGEGFALDASGTISKQEVALTTSARIDQVAKLSPELSGNLAANATINGRLHDFAVQAKLTGAIGAQGQKSGPFNIDIAMQHLPQAATGTLTGGGMLESAPLKLDAAFNRASGGTLQLKVSQAEWRSASVTADLSLVPGNALPTGEAAFSIGRLQDFSVFVPMHLGGGVRGDFAYTDGQTVKLNLTARALSVDPALGTINGTVTAQGPMRALAVRTHLTMAKLQGNPARLDFASMLDVPARAARVTSLRAAWHGLSATLQGETDIATQPEISVRHLKLALAGGSVALDGSLSPRLNATLTVHDLPLSIANAIRPGLDASGMINAGARLSGTPTAPGGTVTLHLSAMHLAHGPAAALAPADLNGRIELAGKIANLDMALNAGPDIALAVRGQAPLTTGGPMDLRALGRVDLRLLNLFLAAQGTSVRGEAQADFRLTGTPLHPDANGTATLRNGSIENIGSGLNLTQIQAVLRAQGPNVTVQSLTATAGHGTISIQGQLGLNGTMPIALRLKAANASPIASDIITETLNGDLTLSGAVRGAMSMAGMIDITKAEINIPKGLPPSVANLHILNAGEPPPPLPAPVPPVALNVELRARNQIFVRGDGLFAELGGHVHLGGDLAAPDPEGQFDLIRGNFALAGKNLKFTRGDISFTGNGFMPTLNLVASASSSAVSNATLTVGGTVAKPLITLSSTPPLPSDEILAQLLFGVSASSLSPFQAASLAAALAQLSGIGGGVSNPLDTVRNALGLDELSLGGSGSGPPSLQAGRYVAPGVYVGATQATNGQGTQVNVQINLYKGLTLQTATGTSATGGNSNSVGLSYQFNY